MRINELARPAYQEAKNHLDSKTVKLDSGIARIGDAGLRHANECILLAALADKTGNSSISDFADRTGWECFVNKIHLEDWLDDLALEKQELLIAQAILLAERLKPLVATVALRFIVSFDEMSCTLRMHQIRQGEDWLNDDLESYREEGILCWDL